MQEVQPDFESIYTPEYWGNIPPMRDFQSRTTLGKLFEVTRGQNFNHGGIPNRALNYEIQEALGRSAIEIYTGASEPTPIPNDVIVGGKDDTEYAIPGNILLIDKEQVFLHPNSGQTYKKQIQNEFELQASAVRIVKGNFKYKTSFHFDPLKDFGPNGPLRSAAEFILKPFIETEPHEVKYYEPHMEFKEYDVALYNPEKGRYYRTVDLVAFFSTKDGKTGARTAVKSFIGDSGHIHSWLGSAVTHNIGRVGETFNRTIDSPKLREAPAFERTRSAYVCARGAFEHAPAKVKKKSRSKQLSPALNTNN